MDDEFLQRFADGSLPESDFRHADHVRAAWLYLRRWPPAEALARFSADLRHFAASKGKPDRYHETVTWAYLLLIRERVERSGRCDTWDEFAAANPDLLAWPGVLGRYYAAETLASELARRVFLFPEAGHPA